MNFSGVAASFVSFVVEMLCVQEISLIQCGWGAWGGDYCSKSMKVTNFMFLVFCQMC